MSVLRGLGDEARQKHMTVANIRSKMQAMSGCLGLLFHECFELHGAPGLGFLAWGPPPGGSSASTTRSCVIKTFAIFAAPARPTTRGGPADAWGEMTGMFRLTLVPLRELPLEGNVPCEMQNCGFLVSTWFPHDTVPRTSLTKQCWR